MKEPFLQMHQKSLGNIARQQVNNARLVLQVLTTLSEHPYQIREEFFRQSYLAEQPWESDYHQTRYCLKDYLRQVGHCYVQDL